MHPGLEKALLRWTGAGVLDAASADRIRAFEARRGQSHGLRWPVLVAISLGGILLGSGVLLFVSAHWDSLSPASRFSLVLLLVAVFHVSGAVVAGRFAALATVLHAVGTVSLGAGIFMAGQIFHLQEHWPGGVMLWAIGAWLGWALLRDWPQAALAAVLTPAWLAGEWTVATGNLSGGDRILLQGLTLTAITYLSARLRGLETSVRRALGWIGGLALIPCAASLAESWSWRELPAVSGSLAIAGWTLSVLLPLGLAWWLRRSASWMNLVAALWVLVLATMSGVARHDVTGDLLVPLWREAGRYLWYALGSVALIAWGLKEGRKERINLGIAGFALTVLFFYFSSVMDKLGRAASLIGLGLLFLAGGWLLERARRRLIARLTGGAA
jgi:MFS family permease